LDHLERGARAADDEEADESESPHDSIVPEPRRDERREGRATHAKSPTTVKTTPARSAVNIARLLL